MSKRLSQNLNSHYLEAAQRLNSRKSRQKIVAYVESYDDILFWRSLLSTLEDDKRYFEVMLPSCNSLNKGKKVALMNVLGPRLGNYMIACVDADYDYLMQGATETSKMVCSNPYVFHTYTYAIENFQCYAPTLHNVCVMATLNDRVLLDFEAFLSELSKILHPLFVWSVWCYKHRMHSVFPMTDLCSIISIEQINLYHPENDLERIRGKVNHKINWLQHRLPQAKGSYKPLMEELKALGVTPEMTYLYIRGHDLFDNVVLPILGTVCDALRREREKEIKRLAEHNLQRQNELAGYQHSASSPEEMLRKQTGYVSCPLYQKIIKDVKERLGAETFATTGGL